MKPEDANSNELEDLEMTDDAAADVVGGVNIATGPGSIPKPGAGASKTETSAIPKTGTGPKTRGGFQFRG